MEKIACEWSRIPVLKNGIIVACDIHQEWLLSWWWERYHAENTFPVTFVDFGMSIDACDWCHERGDVISLPIDGSFVVPREEIPLDLAAQWEKIYGPELWLARPHWFKKPFACLQSPYQNSIWIDLDCEIMQSIDDLFSETDSSSQLALVREYGTEHLLFMHPDVRYNAGVICFQHGTEIMKKWAQDAILRNAFFWSDDALLSALIYELQWPVKELCPLYNWRMAQGVNINAIINHWVGSWGKAFIKSRGGIKSIVQQYSIKPSTEPKMSPMG